MKVRVNILAAVLTLLIFAACNSDSSEESVGSNLKSANRIVDKFLFVGVVGETPSLYLYNLTENKFKRFWYKPRENVIDLSVSPDFMKAFFITAPSIEEGGTLPLIRKVKLYLVDLKSMKITHIKNYGITGQIITSWEDENNFKLILNTMDKIIATDINQTTQLYNSFGKLLIDESKTFDLLKDGYPQPPKVKKNYESPSKRYYLQIADNKQAYFLNDKTTNQKDTISSVSLFVNQFEWSYDKKYLVANFTMKNNLRDTSSILVYSLPNKKNQTEWRSAGTKNFILLNELLVFDNGVGTESELVIYNCETDKVINNVRIKGGCGLKNIPGVLTYDVVD